MSPLGRAPLAAAVAALLAAPATALTLAEGGVAHVGICVERDAPAPVQTAADELAEHLGRMAGTRIPRTCGAEPPLRALVRVELDPALADEAWRVDVGRAGVRLAGGGARGPLHATWRFLEDDLGVRWWTPRERWIPRRDRVAVRPGRREGRPAFALRDLHGLGPAAHPWAARNRLNGSFTWAPAAWGGRIAFPAREFVHTSYLHLPPERYFDAHPEFYSELAGLRFGGEAQLCATEPAVAEAIAARILAQARAARASPPADGVEPTTYDVSQNDWGRPCACDRCSASAERAGTLAGPVLELAGAVAARVRAERPDLSITTLAYGYSADPPSGPDPPAAVPGTVVRLAGLYERDFLRPLTAPSNAAYRARLEGWVERAEPLWIWDYLTSFGEAGDLPGAVLDRFAADLRAYRAAGVEGVFFQHADPVGGDLYDLRGWVAAKLVEDPTRDPDALAREFAFGYYGDAAPALLAYRRWGERAFAGTPRLGFAPDAVELDALDAPKLRRAQELFDRALARVAGHALLERRVRDARIALDRVTLFRLEHLDPAAIRDAGAALDGETLWLRYRAAAVERLRRLPPSEQGPALDALAESLHAVRRYRPTKP